MGISVAHRPSQRGINFPAAISAFGCERCRDSPAVALLARAQAYPTRPVRIIVGFPPGGPTDIAARPIGQWLFERFGQQFVIENRPGAGSNIGTEAVVRSTPDGYTLLLAYSTNAINATLYDKLNFNFIRDIAPVASISRETTVMVVHPSFPAKTVPEFVAYAKANPGKINFASGGNGTPPHVVGELFKMMAGVNLVHVPYRGGAPAVTDLLGGQVQVMFASPSISIEHIRAHSFAHWREPLRRAWRRCRTFRPWAISCWASRRACGRHRRTEEHAGRNHGEAQQRGQCGLDQSEDKGTTCRPRQHRASRFARRLRHAHR